MNLGLETQQYLDSGEAVCNVKCRIGNDTNTDFCGFVLLFMHESSLKIF